MQCSNCQFQNMPGIQTCGRCGANLQLAALVIDVHPPRASVAAKRWRRWLPVARYGSRFRAAVADARASSALAAKRLRDWTSDIPTSSLIVRMVVPGWAQWYAGRAIRGRWMFWGYVGCLLSGLLFAGTPLGLLLLGLAISLHTASIMDIVATGCLDFVRRLIYGGAAMLVLAAVVYYPAGWLLSQVAVPQRFNLAVPPFEAG